MPPHRALYPVPSSVGEKATGSPAYRSPATSVQSLRTASSSPPDALKGVHYYEYGDNKTEQAAKHYWDEIKGPQP